jgi:UDP-N-acetylmuramyl pentapeptide phosphotransferase/UDP-N-acetylglucosamine-1-phosphate transferase
MNGTDLIQGVGAAALAGGSVVVVPRTLVPVVRNHRGLLLPLALGWSVAGASVVVLGARAIADAVAGRVRRPSEAWAVLAIAIVFAAGVLDDRQPSRRRGLVAHLRAVTRGEVTTGVVKLVAAVIAAAVWVAASHGSFWRATLGVPVIAGCANLVNLLDVAPGRAVKGALVAAVVLAFVRADALVLVTLGACLGVLVPDLRERAMLGDAGSNVIGIMLGITLYDRVGTLGLAVALTIILALHALAETVSFSRIIEATPPIRWVDRLGRP